MALPAPQDEKLAAALALERARTVEVERAAFDGPSRSAAHGWRLLLTVHEQRAERVRASGDVHALDSLLRDIAAEIRIPSVVLTEAERRTFTGAVREVGGGIARDVAQVAQDTGAGWLTLLKASPLVLVGLGVLAVVVFFRRP